MGEKLISIFYLLVIINIFSFSKRSVNYDISCIEKYSLPDSLPFHWKVDSLGCQALRSRYFKLFEEDKIIGMNKFCITDIFGVPNYFFNYSNRIDYVYLTGGRCIDDKFSDFCEVWISVQSDTIFNTVIECD